MAVLHYRLHGGCPGTAASLYARGSVCQRLRAASCRLARANQKGALFLTKKRSFRSVSSFAACLTAINDGKTPPRRSWPERTFQCSVFRRYPSGTAWRPCAVARLLTRSEQTGRAERWTWCFRCYWCCSWQLPCEMAEAGGSQREAGFGGSKARSQFGECRRCWRPCHPVLNDNREYDVTRVRRAGGTVRRRLRARAAALSIVAFGRNR